jgi:hypothetical protein
VWLLLWVLKEANSWQTLECPEWKKMNNYYDVKSEVGEETGRLVRERKLRKAADAALMQNSVLFARHSAALFAVMVLIIVVDQVAQTCRTVSLQCKNKNLLAESVSFCGRY